MKDTKETRLSQHRSDTHMNSRRSHCAQGLYLSALNRVLELREIVDTGPPLNQLFAVDNFSQIKKLVFCNRVSLGIQSILTGRPYAQKAETMKSMAFLKVLSLIMLCQAFFFFFAGPLNIYCGISVCANVCVTVSVFICVSHAFPLVLFLMFVCLVSLVMFCCFVVFYYCYYYHIPVRILMRVLWVWVCKEEKRILEELQRGTIIRIYYIKSDYSI